MRDGIDPSAAKQARKRAQRHATANTFKAVAEEWLRKQRNVWDPGHAEQVKASLENNLFPDLGTRPIAEIEAPELLAVLRKIEDRGAHEMRQRAQQRAGAVFRYGIATGRCMRDPAADLRGALTPPAVRHHPALSASDLPKLFRALGEYELHPQTKLAVRFLVLTAVRTGEMRGADWSEFDLDNATWRIPAERMKMGDEHIVPLSKQALEVLAELRELNGDAGLVFRNANNPAKPMSENTVLYALYRLGYHSRATGHGFRSTFSTWANETGYNVDWIERQLAHMERN
jgi:integrase